MTDDVVRIVEWYRADHGPRMRRILIAGPAVLTLGGLVVAVSFMGRHAELRVAAALAGLALVASGAVFTAAAMYWTLRQDAYVALRTDGLTLHGGSASSPEETFIAWDALVEARWDAGRAELRLERVAGEAVVVTRRYAGVTLSDLAHKIERTRLRAAMGLLR
jgi:hypothetical protein